MQSKHILLSPAYYLTHYNVHVSGSNGKKILYITYVNMSVFKYILMNTLS